MFTRIVYQILILGGLRQFRPRLNKSIKVDTVAIDQISRIYFVSVIKIKVVSLTVDKANALFELVDADRSWS